MGSERYHAGPMQSLSPIYPVDRISIGSIFAGAHAIFSERWGTLVGCAAIMLIYGFISSSVVGLLDALLVGPDSWFSPLEFLHSIVISTPLSVGPVYIAAATFRGQHSDIGDLFIGFRRWLPIMLIALIIQAAIYLSMLPIGIAFLMLANATGFSAVTVILLIALSLGLFVMALYLGIRIYFATLLCADPLGPRLGAIESLAESWRITRNHAGTLLAAAVLISLIAIISFLFLIVPIVLYGMPLTYAAGGCVYVYLTHRYGIIPITGYDMCPYCGYDLKTLDTNRCPECGAFVPRPEPTTPEPSHWPQPHEAPAPDLPDIPLIDDD